MIPGKSYLIQVPDGKQVKATCELNEGKHYTLRFESKYSKKSKRVLRSRFESGIACLEGTDHLVLKEL